MVYPPQCACCRAELEEAERAVDLCEECQKRLIPLVWTPVRVAAVYFEGICIPSRWVFVHARIRPFISIPWLRWVVITLDLKHIISRMKTLAGEPLIARPGQTAGNPTAGNVGKFSPEVIVPIPMYWRHRLRRRMNSPEFIAQSLAKFLEIPVRRWLLVRCKKTRTQSNLPPDERFRNVRGAFRVRFARQIRGRRVLLVDDVLTTGATCSEAAKVLKQAGAAMVAVAVVARAHGENR